MGHHGGGDRRLVAGGGVSLDPGYLAYPRRAQGYDHDLYAWTPGRAAGVRWPEAKRVAVWFVISAEHFPLIPSDAPFRAPGHMQTPYPDYRHYTARDYGLRVGLWRLLDALETRGIAASVAVNGAVAERHPELLDAVLEGGHEVIAHSTDMNGAVASGMGDDAERAIIAEAQRQLAKAAPTGWLSVARSQSFRTHELLAEAGFRYMCDWPIDDVPVRFASGIVNLPLNHELSDRQIIVTQGASAESWAEQMRDAYATLDAEGGRVLPIHVTPYILGLPYRAAAFEALLDWLRAQPGCWFAQGRGIVEAFEA